MTTERLDDETSALSFRNETDHCLHTKKGLFGIDIMWTFFFLFYFGNSSLYKRKILSTNLQKYAQKQFHDDIAYFHYCHRSGTDFVLHVVSHWSNHLKFINLSDLTIPNRSVGKPCTITDDCDERTGCIR